MVAIRSFFCGYVGFSYTTDTSVFGLERAIQDARNARTFLLAPPTPAPYRNDEGYWEDRSEKISELEKVWDSRTMGTDLVLTCSRTLVIHVRSDGVPVTYSDGSSSALVKHGFRTEVMWSRRLDERQLRSLLIRTSRSTERPWSLAHYPVIFTDSAGGAVTAIILRGLTSTTRDRGMKVVSKFPDHLCLVDDAGDPQGPAGGLFDGEGWPTKRRILGRKGQLTLDPKIWGTSSSLPELRGLSWRRDLARPPVLAPSNVMLIPELPFNMKSGGRRQWIAGLDRGMVCDFIALGSLSMDVNSGTFAVPCAGQLVRRGEIVERRVRGVLQGTIEDLVDGIHAIDPLAGYTPSIYGIRHADVLVASGLTMRGG